MAKCEIELEVNKLMNLTVEPDKYYLDEVSANFWIPECDVEWNNFFLSDFRMSNT